MKQQILNFLIEIGSLPSRLLNVLTGGSADLTFSARSHKEGLWTEKWVDRLFFWQDAHCEMAWGWEVERSRANVALFDSLRY